MSRQVSVRRVEEATWTLNGTPIGRRPGNGGERAGRSRERRNGYGGLRQARAAPAAPGSREARRRLSCCGQLALSALSRSFRRTETPGGTACGAQAPSRSRSIPEPWGRPPLACPRAVADSPSPSMCAGFLRCLLPALTADGRRQLVGQLPAVCRADVSLALAVLATRYGAAGMSMWNQLERSLVPCSLMALIR